MKGITEERLNELAQNNWRGSALDLIDESRELNPWQTIESAPKDRRILLLYPMMVDTPKVTGKWSIKKERFVADIVIHGSIKPTHWCELPEDPK